MTDDEFFEDALERWEEADERGESLSPHELCRARPHLADRVAEAVGRLGAVEWILRTSGRPVPAAESGYRPGDKIAGYELIVRVGAGGFGEVWEGRGRRGARVAIKVPLTPPGTGVPPIIDEVEIASRLDHKNIVPVFASGMDGDKPYIVSKLIDGETLAARIARGPVGAGEARHVARQIAAALSYARGRGVIHRDLKPANVLVDRDGRAYLTDFGIGLVSWDWGRDRTGGTGTADYMAPEQFRGHGILDGRCDLYALGVVMYEMITGRLPFDGGRLAGLSAKLAGHAPPDPADTHRSVPADLAEAVRRCLAPDPNDRFATAEEVLVALGGLAPPLPAPANRPGGTPAERMDFIRRLAEAGQVIPADQLPGAVELLRNPEYSRRVVRILVKQGSAAVPALLNALSDSDPKDVDFRRAVVVTLGRIGAAAPSAVPVLQDLLADAGVGGVARIALAAVRPKHRAGWRVWAVVGAAFALTLLGIAGDALGWFRATQGRVTVSHVAFIVVALGAMCGVIASRSRRMLLAAAFILGGGWVVSSGGVAVLESMFTAINASIGGALSPSPAKPR